MSNLAFDAALPSVLSVVLVAALVAATAGLLRYLTSLVLNSHWPFGTLAVNSIGSLVAGAASGLTGGSQTIVVIAGLGALTSVSAVAAEATTMLQGNRSRSAFLYLAATIVIVVLSAWLGLEIAT